MTWRDLYPEGSLIFIGRTPYIAVHNEFGIGVDLHCLKTGELAMTIAPDFIPSIASAVKYPR